MGVNEAHPGPCLNYAGQDPAHYDEYDSCYLHLQSRTELHREMIAVLLDLNEQLYFHDGLDRYVIDKPWDDEQLSALVARVRSDPAGDAPRAQREH